jgi:hypothetical protein
MSEPKKVNREFACKYQTLTEVLAHAEWVIENNPGMTLSDFCFDTYHPDPYEDYEYPCMSYETPETPPEKQKRLADEAKTKATREEWERKQFEQLKAKYGTDN